MDEINVQEQEVVVEETVEAPAEFEEQPAVEEAPVVEEAPTEFEEQPVEETVEELPTETDEAAPAEFAESSVTIQVNTQLEELQAAYEQLKNDFEAMKASIEEARSENETLKNFIDLINGQYKYQEKNRQEEITYISHNICFITYNPKQKPLLTDYSVSYEKRYFPLECKQNEQTFKEKYLHTIEEEREQIWAQIYEWTINNEDAVNELDKEDIKELKVIQERNKGITKEDILTKIDYWLNEKTYNKQRIIDIDEIKQSEKQTDNYNKNILLSISITAFEELLKYIGYDSRHKSFIDKDMMYNIGWEKKPTTINNRSVNAWVRMKDKLQPSLPI